MAALAFNQVAVWLDDRAPEHGAFAHALAWAERLRLPLTAFAGGTAERLQACEAACARRGVAWDTVYWDGPLGVGLERFLCPLQLCTVSSALPPPVRQALWQRSQRGPQAPLLVGPPSWQPVCRVLVVNQVAGAGSSFLDTVAEICGAFAVAPIVLTTARSEHEVRLRQQVAEERLAGHRLPADFDSVVGCDAAEAAAAVARWRRCTHVFVETSRASSWWGRPRGDLPVELLRLSGSLTVLALPGVARPATVRRQEQPAAAPRWAGRPG
jgi:hypothetical protein